MTTETTSQLPVEPLRPNNTHFHDIDIYAISEGHDCAREASLNYRCYGQHRSEPASLPEVTDEMVDRAVVTYVNTYYAYDAGTTRAAMRAALTEFRADLIAGIPQWQPIEHAQIKAGMRIRATVQCDDRATIYVGVAHHQLVVGTVAHHHQAVGTRVWCTEDDMLLTGWGDPTTYEVDPATIPDPDAELIEAVGKAIHDADKRADDWDEDPSAETYRKLARAALTALRTHVEAGERR